MATTPPRILLVDDDASMRRFVAMALEDQEVTLACAASVPQALDALRRQGPVQLLFTDIMMPGASGVDLLRTLAQEPALRGDAKVVVLSAGLAPASEAQLAGLGVWLRLRKPVSLADLVACVADALGDGAPLVPQADAPPSASPAVDDAPAALEALRPDQARAVERHFGGDRGLFLAYHASCIREFANDLPRGDAAVAARDAQALRRQAHSLKSVLATLGYDAPSALARRLEEVASAADWTAALPLWEALHRALSAIGQGGNAGLLD